MSSKFFALFNDEFVLNVNELSELHCSFLGYIHCALREYGINLVDIDESSFIVETDLLDMFHFKEALARLVLQVEQLQQQFVFLAVQVLLNALILQTF